MTWTDIPNSDVDPGSPLSTALMTALRDNTEAQIGRGQTPQDLSGSRARFTVYQNTTDRPIWVCAQYQVGTGSIQAELFISADNVTFFVTGKSSPSGSNEETGVSSIVPVDFYYKVETNVDPDISELRWIEVR